MPNVARIKANIERRVGRTTATLLKVIRRAVDDRALDQLLTCSSGTVEARVRTGDADRKTRRSEAAVLKVTLEVDDEHDGDDGSCVKKRTAVER
jgi:hypothetical protein